MQKMLITGAAGFIGSAFSKIASNTYDICMVDALTYAGDIKRIKLLQDKYPFHQCDISDKSTLEQIFIKEKPQIIVHFAAETHVDRSILDPDIFIRTNIQGTQNLLELSKDAFFVNISTDEVYGDLSKDDESFTEISCLNPSSPYSVSKASQDMLARAYARTYNMDVLTIRASNNYGPWQYPEKLIPVVIYKALQNESIPIYAQGLNIREWTFVDDFAKAILTLIINNKKNAVHNIGSSIEKSNIDVVKTIIDLLNKPHSLITFVQDRPGHDFRYSLDSKKFKSEFLDFQFRSFEQGVEDTVKWYLQNKNWLFEKAGELAQYWKKVYIRL